MNSKERVQFSQEAFNWGTPYGAEPIKQIYTYEGLLNMYLSHDISSEDFWHNAMFWKHKTRIGSNC